MVFSQSQAQWMKGLRVRTPRGDQTGKRGAVLPEGRGTFHAPRSHLRGVTAAQSRLRRDWLRTGPYRAMIADLRCATSTSIGDNRTVALYPIRLRRSLDFRVGKSTLLRLLGGRADPDVSRRRTLPRPSEER
ncbi:hypothetical protein Nans01_27610 [Nocardiopsis ansamitocini]|uniref:Uncharacterized protein n=1 Tax=Nocardiopsis ansamitocini TaxID=1670832 RepID=A0A9W6UJU0_9ACTN|nr:hypothetical protein Nans01_27610 [Nocardiopsis ansamitocini]